MAIKEVKWESLKKPKRHNWLDKQKFGYFFELVIKDETNRKMDRFIWNTKQKFLEILEILKQKYGMG